jgi:hypothetical protein
MQKIMKKILLTLSLALMSLAWLSCTEENNVVPARNAGVSVQYIRLQPNAWVPLPDNYGRWYQPWEVQAITNNVDLNGTVICYYMNEFESWESLPKSTMLFTEEDVVYSEEIFYSYKPRLLTIDYRNTHPSEPTTPNFPIDIKIVILDEFYVENGVLNGVDLSDHDRVMEVLNIKDNQPIE